MNVAYFLKPKSEIAVMQSDFTVRQGLEKLKLCGYSAIPVIDRKGRYVGTIGEKEFLNKFTSFIEKSSMNHEKVDKFLQSSMKALIRPDAYPAVSITASASDLMNLAVEQNFVPVVDDDGIFIGIVTRRDIIKYFAYSFDQ